MEELARNDELAVPAPAGPAMSLLAVVLAVIALFVLLLPVRLLRGVRRRK